MKSEMDNFMGGVFRFLSRRDSLGNPQAYLGYTNFTRRDGCKESEPRGSVLLLRYPCTVERRRRRAHGVSRRPCRYTTRGASCLADVLWLVYRHSLLLPGSAAGISPEVARIIRSCRTGFSAVAIADSLAYPGSIYRRVPGRVECASLGDRLGCGKTQCHASPRYRMRRRGCADRQETFRSSSRMTRRNVSSSPGADFLPSI